MASWLNENKRNIPALQVSDNAEIDTTPLKAASFFEAAFLSYTSSENIQRKWTSDALLANWAKGIGCKKETDKWAEL